MTNEDQAYISCSINVSHYQRDSVGFGGILTELTR